jgi:hypothetical protein
MAGVEILELVGRLGRLVDGEPLLARVEIGERGDLDAARAADAPRIDADAPDNVLFRTRIESGSTAESWNW